MNITIADLRANRTCDLHKRVADLTAHLGRVPAEDEPIQAEVWWTLPSTSMHDAVWLLRCTEPAEEAHRAAVRVAVAAARAVEHLLPADGRAACVAAIQAAEEYLRQPTPEKLAKVGEARDAARAAAYAADVAVSAAAYACMAAARAAATAYAAATRTTTYVAAYACAAHSAACAAADACADAATCARVDSVIQAALAS